MPPCGRGHRIYIAQAPRVADRIDRAFLLGLLFFLAACSLSVFPRQSFDVALATFAYVGAFFHLRTAMSHTQMRSVLVTALRLLSLTLTLFFASLWLVEARAWISLTGDLPPPGLRYPSFWWGHRYDVVFLLLLVYPAWWIGRPHPVKTSLAIVLGALTLLLTLLSGSRTLWMAVVVASLFALAGPAGRALRPRLMPRVTVAAVAIAVLIALTASGATALIVQRVLQGGTITARFEMWGILTGAWLEHPIAGFGPGSFPLILQTTGYFDTTSFAPRHPQTARSSSSSPKLASSASRPRSRG